MLAMEMLVSTAQLKYQRHTLTRLRLNEFHLLTDIAQLPHAPLQDTQC